MAVLDKKRTAMVKKLEELIAKLRRAFLGTYADALMELKSNIENGADFTWKDNPIAEKKIDQMIDMLTQKSYAIISNGVTHYQQYGTQSALDALRERARQIAAKYGNQKFINRGATDEIKALDKEATNQRRIDAVGGHSRTIANRGGGMNNLSKSVWNLNDQVKKEIEIIVQDSIRKGYSTEYAIKLAQKYLNNPNEIDAWKKDENGEWYQTPAAKDYHPGRGVYKSAIKNVERMIRTETMAAYRTAEIEQYQKNPMIKGYRIQLSSNHTTTHGHHGVKEISDICDRLQGDYPKSFVWTGWHPNCRCVLIPIMLTDEEFAKYLKAKREGKLDEFAKKTNIQDFPENMTEWMSENKPRIQEVISNPQKELPTWVDSVRKESDVVDMNGIIQDKYLSKQNFEKPTINENRFGDSGEGVFVPTEIPVDDFNEVKLFIEDFLNFSEPDIIGRKVVINPISKSKHYGESIIETGVININFATDKNGFNCGECLVSAFKKIQNKETLNFDEEYSIEVLWHELLHVKSKNRTILPKVEDPDGFVRVALETINQFVARKTYRNDFLREIGGKNNVENYKWIMSNGYGYNPTVQNFRILLQCVNISEKDIIYPSMQLLMSDYLNFDQKMTNVLKSLYKGNGDIKTAFEFIEYKPLSFINKLKKLKIID